MLTDLGCYCGHCFHVVRLSFAGTCPACGAHCPAYPLLLEAAKGYAAAFKRLPACHLLSVRRVYVRGELETGEGWTDMLCQAARRIRPGDHNLSADPQSLPKLDIVGFSLVHERGAELVLHDPGFDPAVYYMGGGLCVPWHALFGGNIAETVFASVEADGHLSPRFFELIPMLQQVLAWNRLWYACLALDFWLVREEPFPGGGLGGQFVQDILQENLERGAQPNR